MIPPLNESVAGIRTDYVRGSLNSEELLEDAMQQFEAWLATALQSAVVEPTAMSLATASESGAPLLRTVLLKGYDARGFVFFTNLQSRKAIHLRENERVSLLFPWLALERQIIVTGSASLTARTEVDEYFATRPRESQLAAWASHQSQPIATRDLLASELERIRVRFAEGKIPAPPFWGGYRVEPTTIEFWQGGPSRLHDRFEYSRVEDGSWRKQRLSP